MPFGKTRKTEPRSSLEELRLRLAQAEQEEKTRKNTIKVVKGGSEDNTMWLSINIRGDPDWMLEKVKNLLER